MPDRPARRGLERPPLIHTRDLEMARMLLSKVYGDLTADVRGDGHDFEWRASLVDMGPVTLAAGAFAPSVGLSGVTSGYTVSLAAGGSIRAAASGDAAEVVAGLRGAVLSPGARSDPAPPLKRWRLCPAAGQALAICGRCEK